MRRSQIAVVGSASGDAALLETSRRLGEALVNAGHRIVCGGLTGVMEAVAKGARESPGRTGSDVIGILPTLAFQDANPYVDIVIPSGLQLARNTLVVTAADAVVAVGGGAGTLSEIALAWQLKKPILAIRGHGGWARELAGRAVDARRSDGVVACDSVDEVIKALETELARGQVDNVGF